MIRSIRISRDQFAAENHSAGGTSVEIITQPGHGPDSLQHRLPLSRRTAERAQSVHAGARARADQELLQINLNGTLVPQKASFNFNVDGLDSYETPNINAFTVGGIQRSEALRAPHAARQHARECQRRLRRDAQSDAALRLLRQPEHRGQPRHRRVRLRGARLFHRELEPQRPHAAHGAARTPHVHAHAPAGERGPIPSRSPRSRRRPFASSTRSPAAARNGPAASTRAPSTPASDLDYVRGIHSLPRGARVQLSCACAPTTPRTTWAPTRSKARRPSRRGARAATRSASAIRTSATTTCRGARTSRTTCALRRNLTFSAGMRYEAQTHVDDYNGLMPRVGVTWAPFKSGADDAAIELGHLSRLAADAAPTSRRCGSTASASGRWTSAQPGLSRRGRHRRRLAGQPLPPRRRPAPAAHQPRQRRRRSAPAPAGPDHHDLRLPARIVGVSRAESERPGGRRAARPGVRQHHRGRVGRQVTPARSAVCDDREPGRAVPGVQRAAHQLETDRPCSPTTRG